MNLKAYYFKPSLPLIRENIRKFWPISVFAFFCYFFSLAFPIIMAYDNLSNSSISYYIQDSLSNYQPVFLFTHVFFAVVASVFVFRYLHNGSSVTVMHALPFNRPKMYISNTISGLILISIPIIANGIVLLLLSKPVSANPTLTAATAAESIFTYADVLSWMGKSMVIVIFIYALSMLAGLVTGNILMHFAMACLFNFIVPILFTISTEYAGEFLFGFNLDRELTKFIMHLSPVTAALQDSFNTASIIWYLLISVIVLMVAGLLYEKRKLERSGDPLVFLFMHPIICFIIAFLGMTTLGFFMVNFSNSDSYFSFLYMGFALGAILFFIIGQMIVKKTTHIFNKKSLRDFLIFGIMATVAITCLNYDVLGFEKKTPSLESTKSVFFFVELPTYSTGFYNGDGMLEFKEPANIQAVSDFHKDVIENYIPKFDSPKQLFLEFNTRNTDIAYNLGKGKQNRRLYYISEEFLRNSKALKTIVESYEYKKQLLFQNSNINNPESLALTNKYNSIELNSDEINEFMKSIDLDIKAHTLEDLTSHLNTYCEAVLTYWAVDPHKKTKFLDTRNFTIPRSYKNTMKWLTDKGYNVDLDLSVSKSNYIEFSYKNETIKITDPDEIEVILETFETSSYSQNIEPYIGILYYPGVTKLSEQGYLNYSEESVPEFIVKKFEEL